MASLHTDSKRKRQLIYIYARIIDRSPESLEPDKEDERRPVVILDTNLPSFPSRRRRKHSS